MKLYNQLLLLGLAGIIFRLTITAKGGTCAIINVERCVYIPDLSGNISATLDDMKGKSSVWWSFLLDFSPVLGEGSLVEKYIYHCYSCLDSSALCILHFTMYYELCNPEIGVIRLLLGPACGLWAIRPVFMETTYQLEYQAPWMEEPQGSYLDSPLPKRIPELSVLPNRIINSIMFIEVWPQAYW